MTRPDGAAMHLRHNLMLVQSGQKTRAPGIKKCPDCREHFIDDHRGLPYCGNCRINHTRACGDCGQPFRNTESGDRLCPSCREQIPLFGPPSGGRS